MAPEQPRLRGSAAGLRVGSCLGLLLMTATVYAHVPAAEAQTSPQVSDSLAVVAAAAAFSRAYERGDADVMTALYTPDATIFPDQSEAITGSDGIRRYWTLRPGNRVTHHRMTATSIRVHGTFAHDFGVYEMSGERDGNPWGPVSGKYVVVWHKSPDGQWRMQLDIWNRGPARVSQ